MNYMIQKLNAIERNYEDRRFYDKREIINLSRSQNKIKMNDDICNDIFRKENIIAQEKRKRNNSEFLIGEAFIPEGYQNTYYHGPNRSHITEIVDDK